MEAKLGSKAGIDCFLVLSPFVILPALLSPFGRIYREAKRLLPRILAHPGYRRKEKLSLIRTLGYLYFRGKYQAYQACSFSLLGYSLRVDRPLAAYLLIEELFIREVYAVHLSSKAPVILDGGAHIGLSVLYFKRRYPAAKIIAFEPEPLLFGMLEENVRINRLENITLCQGCLAGQPGSKKLYTAALSLNHTIFAPRESNVPVASHRVKSYQLSSWISSVQVDLVKLDIEGAEAEVIGELAEKGLLRHAAHYLIEVHGMDGATMATEGIFPFFDHAGFHSRRIDSSEISGGSQVWRFDRLD